jgi:two-component sensor histidine kinase
MEKKAEVITLVVIWLIAFATPVLSGFEADSAAEEILRSLLGMLPFFILFMINHFLLVPFWAFKSRYGRFLVCNAVLVAAVFVTTELTDFGRPPQHEMPPQPEMPSHHEMPPPPPDLEELHLPPSFEKKFDKPKKRPPFKTASIVLAVLVIGCDCGVRFGFRFIKIQRETAEKEKQYSQNRLAALKQQVSPHFFMNTLNNIHALIDIDPELAKETVIRLSKMMRYMLYNCDSGISELGKETDFVSEYISLMRLRYSDDKVKITLQISDELPFEKKVPSLIFISLIENAFKHGVSYKKKSFIDVSFFAQDKKLCFLCKNSVPDEPEEKKKGGIGLKNTVSRLDLIYGRDYDLVIKKEDDVFNVKLSFPLL